jgi:hypothetical protein
MDPSRACRRDRAGVVAQEALQNAERNVGFGHPDVADCLNSVA